VKLLELAASSEFPEEAATAKNLAAELLAKHDIATCETKGEQEGFIEVDRFNSYDLILFSALANKNGLSMYTGYPWYSVGGGYYKNMERSEDFQGHEGYKFAGRPSDTEAFTYMREIVLAQREAALASYCLETGKSDRSQLRESDSHRKQRENRLGANRNRYRPRAVQRVFRSAWKDRPCARGCGIMNAIVERARAIRIEDELARRGLPFWTKPRHNNLGQPCPMCGGRDRFSVNIRKQVFFCRDAARPAM
jgi:Protein of unknown function (DUF2786)/Zinc-binding domain of primase-helicase